MKNLYLFKAYDRNYNLIATKEYTGTFKSEFRGFNQMERYKSKAMCKFLHDTGAYEVTCDFRGN